MLNLNVSNYFLLIQLNKFVLKFPMSQLMYKCQVHNLQESNYISKFTIEKLMENGEWKTI